jgi:hypothetical protein
MRPPTAWEERIPRREELYEAARFNTVEIRSKRADKLKELCPDPKTVDSTKNLFPRQEFFPS